MKTITRPVNPFSGKFIVETSGGLFRDRRWEAWEQCREEMDEYYGEVLQDPIGLLLSAEAELAGLPDGGRGNLHQALIFIRNAKDKIGRAVNEKEG